MELFRLSLGYICLLPWLEGGSSRDSLETFHQATVDTAWVTWDDSLSYGDTQEEPCLGALLDCGMSPQSSPYERCRGCHRWIHALRTVAEGQGFLIRNTRLEKCIRVSHHETNGISLSDCKVHSQHHQWSWDPTTETIVSLQRKQCLSVHKMREYALVKLEPCGDRERQAWSCSKKGHLTLQSLGFYLSTKEGGHKVFVSREKDKFSRWKTLADETICAAAQTAAPRSSKPTQQAVDTRVWSYETKTIDSSKIDAVDRESSVGLTHPPLANKFNSTVSPAKTKQAYFPPNEDVSHNHSKKHHGNRGKNAGARLAGTNWKTAMLVLSPLAFILGLIILTLNVHYNKKKKILSALKSSPANSSRADLREPSPLRRGPQPYLPPSRSPSLRRGEILIEWKDGTVTPLFDNANYQMD